MKGTELSSQTGYPTNVTEYDDMMASAAQCAGVPAKYLM